MTWLSLLSLKCLTYPCHPMMHRRGHALSIIPKASASRATGRGGDHHPTRPEETRHCGDGPVRQSWAGKTKGGEANDAFSRGHTPEALAADEGQPSPHTQTKIQNSGRRLLSQADGDSGEKRSCSLCLSPKTSQTSHNQRPVRPVRRWRGDKL